VPGNFTKITKLETTAIKKARYREELDKQVEEMRRRKELNKKKEIEEDQKR
jgi:hypothetical protein